MKNRILKNTLSLLLVTVLIVAMALGFTACNDVKSEGGDISGEISSVSEEILIDTEIDEAFAPELSLVPDESIAYEESIASEEEKIAVSVAEEPVLSEEVTESKATSVPEESKELSPTPLKETVLGEGDIQFTLKVADYDGTETVYTVNTDKTVVGDALKELGVIEGEEGAYGLYVKKVMGIRADYDLDGKYWAFYINGSYAVSGIDSTDIVHGDVYELRVQK